MMGVGKLLPLSLAPIIESWTALPAQSRSTGSSSYFRIPMNCSRRRARTMNEIMNARTPRRKSIEDEFLAPWRLGVHRILLGHD
jgi:hypothetical protein